MLFDLSLPCVFIVTPKKSQCLLYELIMIVSATALPDVNK